MVNNVEQAEVFCTFMEEYTGFFEHMAEQEKEKLEALLSYQLKRIEQAISLQQARAMQLDNYEKKRLELQTAAGFDGKTFREIIAATDGTLRARLEKLFERTDAAVQLVQFYNQKSMESVKLDLQKINGDALSDDRSEARSYTAQKTQTAGYSQSSFEAKI